MVYGIINFHVIKVEFFCSSTALPISEKAPQALHRVSCVPQPAARQRNFQYIGNLRFYQRTHVSAVKN